jgi:hypothetical protein
VLEQSERSIDRSSRSNHRAPLIREQALHLHGDEHLVLDDHDTATSEHFAGIPHGWPF